MDYRRIRNLFIFRLFRFNKFLFLGFTFLVFGSLCLSRIRRFLESCLSRSGNRDRISHSHSKLELNFFSGSSSDCLLLKNSFLLWELMVKKRLMVIETKAYLQIRRNHQKNVQSSLMQFYRQLSATTELSEFFRFSLSFRVSFQIKF